MITGGPQSESCCHLTRATRSRFNFLGIIYSSPYLTVLEATYRIPARLSSDCPKHDSSKARKVGPSSPTDYAAYAWMIRLSMDNCFIRGDAPIMDRRQRSSINKSHQSERLEQCLTTTHACSHKDIAHHCDKDGDTYIR